MDNDVGAGLKARRKELGMNLEDVAKFVGVSVSTVSRWERGEIGNMGRQHIAKLCKILMISPAYMIGLTPDYNPRIRRSVPCRRVCYYESVAAGTPIEANCESVDGVAVPEEYIRPDSDYIVLRVKGDSMYPDFQDGDRVLVELTPDVASGEIAVIYVNGYNATVKRIRREPDGITLIPRNPEYPERTYRDGGEEVMILGRVTNLFRDFV